MARKPTQKQLFDELAARYGVEIAQAFMDAIADLKRAADVRRVIAALSARDVQAAIEALHLQPEAFAPLQDAIARAYGAGGQAAVLSMPPLKDYTGANVVIRFDGRNIRAETWLREHSAQLVTNIVADQREAIRTAATAGMARGENPTATALNIVGRVSKATGQREGGIIGLTAQQAGFVENARAQLASGDPAAMRAYLERGRRDRRFDRSVLKAIREGKQVPAEIAEKAVKTYGNRLLQLRGDQLGLNEAFASLAAAKHEGFVQAVESGKVAADSVTKKWRHFPSESPRVEHIVIAGQTVRFDQPFRLPDGTMMLYPHDPAAPVRHTAGCKCQADYKIDFLADL